jgi:hypothetical protein
MHRTRMRIRATCRSWACGLALAFAAVSACSNDQPPGRDSGGMFGLFGKKSAGQVSKVAPEAGASLQAHTALPSSFAPDPVPLTPACRLAHFRGDPPSVEWVPEPQSGETTQAFILPAADGTLPVAIVARGEMPQVQVWELSDDPSPRFLKALPAMLDPAQSSWVSSYPVAVACLPAGRAAVAVAYFAPGRKDALYVYESAANTFTSLGRIERDVSGGPPHTSFEALQAGPDAVLIAWHTGAIRLGPDNFAYQHDHIMLFSPRYPNGLEVLTLAVNDGNLRGWRMDGETLWLQTLDKRKKPREFIWSLDLGRLL